ncbi:MAG: hypothetical protein JW841_12705 [Deltaproteobacteria bacterium]|nr:hypothetical protein [Deltaproteobacteria bacterium]
MRFVEIPVKRETKVPVESHTLLSGGAVGAEVEFGICAERAGIAEETFSFAGRKSERTRGLVELCEEELRLGDVSDAYLKKYMHRTYPATPLFRKVLQSIWHQVSTAGEVFSVGLINEDNTVKGGTGWAVELAKHWHKPVFVFDQSKSCWFTWQDSVWKQIDPPTITKSRFTGTGTRFLEPSGRDAINSLFTRSFENKR